MIPKTEQQRLDRITAESVDRALEGFPLKPQCSIDRLAAAIREALRISMIMSRDVSWRKSEDFNRKGPRGGPDRKGNATTKQEIADLAKRSANLVERLRGRSKEADHVLWMHAFWNNPGERKEQPSDHTHFIALVEQLECVAGFLGDAAEGLRNQPPRWVSAERQEQRVFHAYDLSTVFEWAFGKPATVASWRDRPEGPWPDFFQRIMSLVFDESKTPNLEKILDEARRRYKDSGALFDPAKLLE